MLATTVLPGDATALPRPGRYFGGGDSCLAGQAGQADADCRRKAGREFEENLRAILSLTAAASARQPDLVALVRSIQIRREDRTVRASFSGGPDAADRLLRFVPR